MSQINNTSLYLKKLSPVIRKIVEMRKVIQIESTKIEKNQ